MHYLLVLVVVTFAGAEIEDGKRQGIVAEQRQFSQGSQYPFDLQYDFPLLDPQLQYPQVVGDGARLQPQVLLYPGGAPGQPFLLQPGAPPGNFLIPQPGVILRDAPPRPPIFVSGYPKPAHVPPINKDAEEIPTNPAAIPPIRPSGRRPEKLETFDLPEKPEVSGRPETEEDDVLGSVDRNLAGVPPLKPGHRFFILNGQPLFSNYPLPNFINSPFQPSHTDPNVLLYRHNAPAFLPDGFNNGLPPYKIPVNGFLVRNSITGQINGARPNDDDRTHNNYIGEQYPQNLISLNRPDSYNEGISLRNSLPVPLQKQNLSPITFLVKAQTSGPEKLEPREKDYLKLRPIEVPDEEDAPLYEGNVKPGIARLDYFHYRPDNDDKDLDKESVIIDAKSDDDKEDATTISDTDNTQPNKYQEPSISQAQPGAVALAGPGGVAAAAPRGTALTGDQGLAVSSPQATAIAGPTRDQIEDKPIKIKKEKP